MSNMDVPDRNLLRGGGRRYRNHAADRLTHTHTNDGASREAQASPSQDNAHTESTSSRSKRSPLIDAKQHIAAVNARVRGRVPMANVSDHHEASRSRIDAIKALQRRIFAIQHKQLPNYESDTTPLNYEDIAEKFEAKQINVDNLAVMLRDLTMLVSEVNDSNQSL